VNLAGIETGKRFSWTNSVKAMELAIPFIKAGM
jgi:hypothetical protein